MSSPQHIKAAVYRTINAVKKKPSIGLTTKQVSARMVGGLKCEMEAEGRTVVSDMSTGVGGEGAAPSPGDLLRMGLASCLATGYAFWFAQRDVPYEDIRVELEGNANHSGMLGIDESVSPGVEAFRVRVQIVSAAPREEIERAVAFADTHSPELHVVAQPISVDIALNVTAPDSATPKAVAQ